MELIEQLPYELNHLIIRIQSLEKVKIALSGGLGGRAIIR